MTTTLNFISAKGAAMPLFGNEYFTLTDIDGMTTVTSDLAAVTVPSVDGDIVTNIQAQPRTVVLYLRLKESAGIEAAKRYILQYIKPKLTGTLQLIQDDREIQLAGIVEAMELPRFGQGCTMQITMHCEQPFWEDIDFVVQQIAQIINLHYFPIPEGGLAFPERGLPFGAYNRTLTSDFDNSGDVETGALIAIIALGEVVNPRIANTQTGEFIGINDTLQGNDEVIINTIKGQKTITKNGVNIIDKIMSGSTFLQIATGNNEFTISARSGINNVYFTLTYKQKYV